MIRARLKIWATNLKKNTYALYLASRDPNVSWVAKWIIILVVAYALSPIDLIPDFIPFIGYLDDLLLLPAGIWLAIKLIPEEVWRDCQQRAQQQVLKIGKNRLAAFVIVVIWVIVMILLVAWTWPLLSELFHS